MKLLWSSTNEAHVAAVAMMNANKAIEMGTQKPAAAVFDIDETLLRNREDDRVAVQPVGKKLYEYAAGKGMDIFLVTARRKSKDSFEFAKKQLEALGYDLGSVKKIYMVSKAFDDDDDYGGRFKREARRRIAKTHSILINAGDRWSDLSAGGEPEDYAPAYAIVDPQEEGVLQGIKFPETD